MNEENNSTRRMCRAKGQLRVKPGVHKGVRLDGLILRVSMKRNKERKGNEDN